MQGQKGRNGLGPLRGKFQRAVDIEHRVLAADWACAAPGLLTIPGLRRKREQPVEF